MLKCGRLVRMKMCADLEGSKKVVGIRQSLKLLEDGSDVKLVFLALDAERDLVESIKCLCEEKLIDVVYVDTRKELGEICGVQVGATVVCVLR